MSSDTKKATKKAGWTSWTSPEIARLRTSYPVMTPNEIAAALPRHSLSSIRSTAGAHGIHKVHGARRWREIAANYVPTFGRTVPWPLPSIGGKSHD